MPFQSLAQLVTLEIFRRVTSNCNVIVVDEQLDVQTLGNSKPCGFCVVTLLLRSIRTQTENLLAGVGESNTIDQRPYVAKTARGEFDSGSETKFRVTRKF